MYVSTIINQKAHTHTRGERRHKLYYEINNFIIIDFISTEKKPSFSLPLARVSINL
jgi:hypothetical protein